MTDEHRADDELDDEPDGDNGIVDEPERATRPDDPVLAAIFDVDANAVFERFDPHVGPAQDIVIVDASTFHDVTAAARDAGFDTFADLCGVDYLRRRPRYEVVLILLSHSLGRRLRIRAGVPGDDPVIDTVSDLYPGANFYEREAYDMFGIVFEGHPDLTRILMPDDWEGFPLRKDYAVGSVPVQFKGAHKAS